MAIGIDIGADSIEICVAQQGADPSTWPTHAVRVTRPGWDDLLLALVRGAAPDCVPPVRNSVALESTGWNYSAPIVQCVSERGGAAVLLVNHAQTQHLREIAVSGQKTDHHDAQALAYCALEYERTGVCPRGCRLNPQLDPCADLTANLRFTLAARARAVTARTRCVNVLRSYAHGIWPSLDVHLGTYLRALSLPEPAATPRQLAELLAALEAAPPPVGHPFRTGITRKNLRTLVADVQNAPEPQPAAVAAIVAQAAELALIEPRLSSIDAQLALLVDDPAIRDVTALWRGVPAANTQAIATLHAACRCHAPEFSPSQFRAAVGCHPLRHESGDKRRTRSPKSGYRPATVALHLWAMMLLNSRITPPNVVRAYFHTLKEAHKQNCLSSTRGKLARVLSGIARTHTPYRGPDES